MLPFSFIDGLYRTIAESDRVKSCNCDDLDFFPGKPFRSESDLQETYREEFQSWRRKLEVHEPRFHIFLLHDGDHGARETGKICRFEAEIGIRSTTSVFYRWIYDGIEEEYPVDFDLLRQLQDDHGLCIAYHTNAMERSNFDPNKALDTFNADIVALCKKGLNIRHFSPHGGLRGPNGEQNHDPFYPASYPERLIWTHNRIGISGSRYTDGALITRLKKEDPRTDLRKFLMDAAALNKRVHLLLHPQYYFAKSSEAARPFFKSTSWLEEYWDLEDRGEARQFWEPLKQVFSSLQVGADIVTKS